MIKKIKERYEDKYFSLSGMGLVFAFVFWALMEDLILFHNHVSKAWTISSLIVGAVIAFVGIAVPVSFYEKPKGLPSGML